MDRSLLATKLCRHGTFTYLRTDLYIGRSLELYGEWAEGEIILFRRLLRPGAVVIDVGANIGTHALPLAKIVGEEGAIYAFEPQQEIFEILVSNLNANNVGNVKAHRAAVGATDGTCRIPQIDYSSANNFGLVSVGKGDLEVPEIAIDSLELQRIDLIKVDVEGAEADVLRGATSTLMKLRPILYVENNNRQKSKALVKLIREMRYRAWWHLSAYYNEANFSGNSHNVWPSLFDPYVICLPEESLVPQWPLEEVRDEDL
jgi:FkbM family methyltransferase